jgi:hypothetical protein
MNTQTIATTPDPVTIRRVALIRPHLSGFELVPLRASDRAADRVAERRAETPQRRPARRPRQRGTCAAA